MTIQLSPTERVPVLPSQATPAPRPPAATRVGRSTVDPGFVDIVDEWGEQSFPASDPPSNW